MNIKDLSVNTLRFLAVDSIEKANSGHPGIALGAAPAMYSLYADVMKYNPKNTSWPDRDRFVLSAGHGSSLLYSVLHLFGYDISIDDLKGFRQAGSITPGHPEYGKTPGVEITTGPLGQGIASAVGFALAESRLAAEFNKPAFPVVDHYTYALSGEGCLMEGVACEAASLAGTMKLGKLILLYDANNITIEGDISTSFDEDILKRFEAYGWQTLTVENGNNTDDITAAVLEAKAEKNKPSIIKIKTVIGHGAPNKQGKAVCHGEPLGAEEAALAKKNLGFEYGETFYVPDEVKAFISSKVEKAASEEKKWNAMFEMYCKKYPEMKEKWDVWYNNVIPQDLLNDSEFWGVKGGIATRSASSEMLNQLAEKVPNIFGGSADLGPSNKTVMKNKTYYSPENKTGANIHYGIREFAMTVISTAIYVHGGLRPYTSGFFAFSDYMKSGLRLQALMGVPAISIFTHDSIGVGVDGPTHQPVEQLAALRSIPNFTVLRPADSRETAAAWYLALTSKSSPSALVLTRQDVPAVEGTGKEALKGGYVVKASSKEVPDMLLIASGSEVSLAVEASKELEKKGVSASVISLLSWEVFEEQSAEYKESVLPKTVRKRLAVEAASSFGWQKYIGLDGDMISVDSFGESMPGEVIFEKCGFTTENIVKRAEALMK